MEHIKKSEIRLKKVQELRIMAEKSPKIKGFPDVLEVSLEIIEELEALLDKCKLSFSDIALEARNENYGNVKKISYEALLFTRNIKIEIEKYEK